MAVPTSVNALTDKKKQLLGKKGAEITFVDGYKDRKPKYFVFKL